jgi:tRNA uridine 5-carboxymethylaminomethyl modification enzyme
LAQILARPETPYADLPGAITLPEDVIQQVEFDLKYSGYVERQAEEVERFKTLENATIPDWVDYGLVPSLRSEARQKLAKIRPSTLGQASRISGVNPSDISIVMIHIKRGRRDANPGQASS